MDKEKLIEGMRSYLEIQGYDGNWNYDPYMHGMYNGMEMMISLVEGREPIFKEAPDEWLSDKPMNLEVVQEQTNNVYIRFNKLHDEAEIPTRGTMESAGLDLYALEDCIVPPCMGSMEYFKYATDGDLRDIEAIPVIIGQTRVRTGIAVEIPKGYFGKVEARSGTSFKHGIETGAGVIDSDYRQEIGVKLYNFTDAPFKIKKGQRVAQLVIQPVLMCVPLEDPELYDYTGRGGFGSTGE